MNDYVDMLAEDISKRNQLLKEAYQLLLEAVDKYPTESDPKLWTSRVREWLTKYNIPNHPQ